MIWRVISASRLSEIQRARDETADLAHIRLNEREKDLKQTHSYAA